MAEKKAPKKQTVIERWTAVAAAQFVGKKVTHVRYLNDAETQALGWTDRAIVLQFEDGSILLPSADDEGNNAGALFTNDEAEPTIPTIACASGKLPAQE